MIATELFPLVYIGPFIECRTSDDARRAEELVDAVEDTLYPVEILGGVVHLIPNVRRDPPRQFEFEGDAPVCADLDPHEVAGELTWLRSEFAGEIDRLQSLCGRRNVTVHWGVLRYAV